MKHRLVTRSDFDGLVCAVLLRKLDMIDDVLFVHPKDVQDGLVDIGANDILTNLPYSPHAHMVFDHHHSEVERGGGHRPNHVLLPSAPSAARVVYEYYGDLEQFSALSVHPALMDAVDKADSAQYSLEDILEPEGWTLLNFLMDSRTGLGRFREFRISNYQLMMQLIDYCIEHQDVDEILALPDVAERVALFQQHTPLFVEQLTRCSRVHDDVVVVDLRGEDVIYAGNRFMVYALHPEARVSVHVIWGRERQNTVLAVGKSIIDRSSPVDIGSVMLRHGGGGHRAAGTCQVPHDQLDAVLADVLASVSAPPAALAA